VRAGAIVPEGVKELNRREHENLKRYPRDSFAEIRRVRCKPFYNERRCLSIDNQGKIMNFWEGHFEWQWKMLKVIRMGLEDCPRKMPKLKNLGRKTLSFARRKGWASLKSKAWPLALLTALQFDNN
jgi:hypothetical protein